MNQYAIRYSATFVVVNLLAEIYGAIYHAQGSGRIATGVLQAVFLGGLAYSLFALGLKKQVGPSPKMKALIIGGLLAWVVSYLAFKLLYVNIGSSLVSIAVPILLMGAISYFLGMRGGFSKNEAADETANK